MLLGELIMTEKFDFNEALKAIQSGQAMRGKDGVLAPLLKQLTEAAGLVFRAVGKLVKRLDILFPLMRSRNVLHGGFSD